MASETLSRIFQNEIYALYGYVNPEINTLSAMDAVYNTFIEQEFEKQYTCSFQTAIVNLKSSLYDQMEQIFNQTLAENPDMDNEQGRDKLYNCAISYILDDYYRKDLTDVAYDLSPADYEELATGRQIGIDEIPEEASEVQEDPIEAEDPADDRTEEPAAAPVSEQPMAEEVKAPAHVKEKKVRVPKPPKPTIPEFLNSLPTGNMQHLLDLFQCEAAIRASNDRYSNTEDVYFRNNQMTYSTPGREKDYERTLYLTPKTSYRQYEEASASIAYLDDKLNLWTSKITMEGQFTRKFRYYYNGNGENPRMGDAGTVGNIHISKWKLSTPGIWKTNLQFIQTNDEIGRLLQANKPYAYDFCNEYNCDYISYILKPQLEILTKAGYRFASSFFTYKEVNKEKLVQLESFTNNEGTKPKDIFKFPKDLYTALKEENSVYELQKIYNLYRSDKMPIECIKQGISEHMSSHQLDMYGDLLSLEYDGKKCFTWHSLNRYLERVNMYEAIEFSDAYNLITDYVRTCGLLETPPRFDSDSLVREHNVAARNYRVHRNEIEHRKQDEQMKNVCSEMKQFEYKERIFFVRAIQNYSDLFDEAKQQSNCVAGYSRWIAERHSYIYVMREIKNPDKSLITIEIDPDTHQVRQQYLAHNQKITNPAQLEFIDRWKRAMRDGRTGELDLNRLEVSKKELEEEKKSQDQQRQTPALTMQQRFAAFVEPDEEEQNRNWRP